MSHKATTWAWEQTGLTPLCKLILLAMADAAGDTGKTFSSSKTLCAMTGISKEDTINNAQARLVERGIIADTGQRVGNTGRIKVFQLPKEACKYVPDQSPATRVITPPPNPPQIPPQSPANLPSGGATNIVELLTVNGNSSGAGAPPPPNGQEKPKATRKAQPFQKPTVDEVKTHGAGMQPTLPPGECEKFWHHHESKGWVVGRAPMKCWKSAMVTWRSNWIEWAGSRPGGTTQQSVFSRVGGPL